MLSRHENQLQNKAKEINGCMRWCLTAQNLTKYLNSLKQHLSPCCRQMPKWQQISTDEPLIHTTEGIFPSCFKHALVVPLLKKPSLDKHAPFRYRPISNPDFISKILERLFLARIQPHITSSPMWCGAGCVHIAYRRHHSIETSIFHI